MVFAASGQPVLQCLAWAFHLRGVASCQKYHWNAEPVMIMLTLTATDIRSLANIP